MKKAKIRFNKGDLVICTFNPFKKYLEFSNKSGNVNEICRLNFDFRLNDKIYACVRISYSGDLVELV